MATRYKTYQINPSDGVVPGDFMTIDTHTEQPPTEYIAVFDTTIVEAQVIESGAILEVVEDELVITPDEREQV